VFIRTVNGRSNKKRKEKKKLTLGSLALVAGTQQTLSNLFWTFDIYGLMAHTPAYFVSLVL
jgi:hypothetical protein